MDLVNQRGELMLIIGFIGYNINYQIKYQRIRYF